jgi:hypothetical protein
VVRADRGGRVRASQQKRTENDGGVTTLHAFYYLTASGTKSCSSVTV